MCDLHMRFTYGMHPLFYLLLYTVLENNSARELRSSDLAFLTAELLFRGPIYGGTREREYAVNFYARFFYGRREKAHLATMLQIADRKHKYRTFKSRSPEYTLPSFYGDRCPGSFGTSESDGCDFAYFLRDARVPAKRSIWCSGGIRRITFLSLDEIILLVDELRNLTILFVRRVIINFYT